MSQIARIKLPDGSVVTPGDWTTAEPLYSTVEIGAAAFSVVSAFSYARGAPVPGSLGNRDSNYADTNLEGEGGRLPENEELICYNIAVEVFFIGNGQTYANSSDTMSPPDEPEVAILDMLRMQRDVYVVFRIANVKEYTNAPLSYFPGSTGVHHVENVGGRETALSAGTVTGFVAAYNGAVGPEGVRTLASPLYVRGSESFVVDFKAGPGQVGQLDINASSRFRFRCFLDGYRRRPVA